MNKMLNIDNVENVNMLKSLQINNKSNIIINSMDNLVYNSKTKRYIKLFKGNKKTINPIIKKYLKKGEFNILELPYGYSIDKTDKKIIPIFSGANNKITNRFRKIVKNNPNRLKIFLGDDKYNFETGRILKEDTIYKKNGDLRKKFKENYNIKNGKLIVKNKFLESYSEGNVISRNNGLKNSYIFRLKPNKSAPTNMKDFVKTIKSSVYNKIPYKYLNGNTKILLRFGSYLKYIPFSDIDNIKDYIGINSGGSDENISLESLNMTFFRPTFLGNVINGGADRKKCNSLWFKTDNAPSKNNCCLEAQINRGLKLNKYAKMLRKELIEKHPLIIKENALINIKDLHLYEEFFECNLDIYEDTPHLSTETNEDGTTKTINNNNLIRKSQKNYDKKLDILLKDSHYCLIIGRKLQISKAKTKKEKQYIKENFKQEDKRKNNKELKPKIKRKELCVFFDIETIFDINDDNLLRSYGGAWYVVDMEKEWKYNEKEDLIKTYYYGENCMEKFVRFLLECPEGFTYKPIGFNNSRFDNFPLCEMALDMGVLRNAFFVDGSILYNVIEGCSPSWDCSRFLPAFSLDKACNSFKTNPKKRKDLIDHYEIQSYFEKNGMEKLQSLLNNNKDLILYNKLDVLCLVDLTFKLRKTFKEMFDKDILASYTISSFGWKIGAEIWKNKREEYNKRKTEIKELEDGIIELKKLNQNIKENKISLDNKIKKLDYINNNYYDIMPPLNFEDDSFIRKSLTAGRTQSFYGKCEVKMPLCMGDIKSLYPSVMGNYGSKKCPNYCPYPTGNYKQTQKYMEGKLGIYNVKIIHQKCKWDNQKEVFKEMKRMNKANKAEIKTDFYSEFAPCVIADRQKDKPLNWFNRGIIEDRVLTSIDIEVLRKSTEDYNCVEVYDGIYWETSSTEIFKDYLEKPKNEKSLQDKLKEEGSEKYNVAKREASKLISNSFSGKLLEKIHTEQQEIFSCKKFLEWEENKNITDLDILDFGGGFSFLTGKKDGAEVFSDCKNNKPSQLGMFVYSYARKLMYEKLLKKYVCLYMDTDSICITKNEWERLLKDYEGLDFVNTGDYGCIEEEVCGKDEKGKIIYADRLIAISPKNYLVENIKCDYMSKRKFKGIRKTDKWLGLEEFGEYNYIYKKGKKILNPKCEAVLKIRSLEQKDIRRYREIKCCNKCINENMGILGKSKKCDECKNYDKKMKNSYTSEMFEYMVNDKPIVVFCSMINKIKYRYGEKIDWEFNDKFKGKLNLESLETITKSNINKVGYKPYSLKINDDEAIEDLDEGILDKVVEREIKDCFKMKQLYLAKII